jgi:16S rRNA (guanine966-N2)-methyltransferase|tara:strand:- start:2730 stop:3293 length:564 start_codon:yes stop_codon:yes gene_type:complete
MRIISGNLKGKKLYQPKDEFTRPLKDLTKESLFNIILHSNKFNGKIKNANVLDLFSGVGSFGLECLSRESSTVTFVENYKIAVPILKRNILSLNLSEKSKVIEKDILNELDFNNLDNDFDIIFLDPPYKEKLLSTILNKIFNAKILSKEGIIIIHRHKNESNQTNKSFNIIEEKIYGISKLIFGNFL